MPLYAGGRIATFKPPVNTYFYEVNDHLGNVRAVIGLPETDTYRATMESENSVLEEPTTGFFKNITPRRVTFVGANVTTNYTNSLGTAVTGNEVVRLNNTAPAGPGISLKVSPGDKINAEVWAYYEAGSTYNTMIPVSTMVTAIAGAFGGVSGVAGESGQIYNAINSGVTGLIGSGTETTLPAAYLQYIMYDANLNPTGQKGFFRVTTSSNMAKAKITMPQITIEQPGFIYIFVYDRSNAANWVFFDEMLVTHVHSTVVAGADYYPLGLAMESREITDEAYRYGYQGQFSEKDLNTGQNGFELRMYDPRIGRWLVPDPYGQFASPYVSMGNMPHMATDPDGGWCCGGEIALQALKDAGVPFLDEFVVTASRSVTPLAALLTPVVSTTSFRAETNGSVTYLSSANVWVNYNSQTGNLASYQGGGWEMQANIPEMQNAHSRNMQGFSTAGQELVYDLALLYAGGEVTGAVLKPVLGLARWAIAARAAKGGVQYTKSSLQLGQQMHKAYKVGDVVEGVAMKEFRGIPGIRPDFVDFSTKTIYELKPFNPRAMQQGWNQLNKYQNLFQQKYGGTWKTVLDTY